MSTDHRPPLVGQHTRPTDADLECAVDALIDRGGAPSLMFQPIAHLPQMNVAGYEVLSRFSCHPGAGPDRWFAAAQRIGREAELSALVLTKALSSRSQLPPRCFLSINISPEALLSDQVERLLGSGPLDRIVFELTEHSVVNDYRTVASAIANIRSLAGFVAVDDAGAGYASLRHILALRPDFVKLDSSLVQDLHRDQAKSALVEMFGEFASRIDAWLVAEGIEERRDLHRLRQLGVPLGQGYLLGRPSESMQALAPETVDAVPTALAAPTETVAAFVDVGHTAGFDTSDAELRATLDSDSDTPAITLLDCYSRPVRLALRDGSRGVRRDHAMCVLSSSGRHEVLRRAMTRPLKRRFDPLVCCDEAGSYTGLIPIDRLIGALAAD